MNMIRFSTNDTRDIDDAVKSLQSKIEKSTGLCPSKNDIIRMLLKFKKGDQEITEKLNSINKRIRN